jgi:hypothetical protein
MIILFFFLIFAVVVGGSIFSFQFLYSFIKPFLKTAKDRRKLLKGFLIFAAVCLSFNLLLRFLTAEPPFFSPGIDQLRQNEYVKSHIGGFASYSFYADSLPKKPKDTAAFSVSLIGDSLTLHLKCIMQRTTNPDKWKLIKIKTDSLTKTP